MKLLLAPMGGGFLIFPEDGPRDHVAGDVIRFDSKTVAGMAILEEQMEKLGYSCVDTATARWLLRGCVELPDSHPLRQPAPKVRAWNQTKRPLALQAGSILPSATVARRTSEARQKAKNADAGEAATETGG